MIGQGRGGVESYVSMDAKPCLVYWTERKLGNDLDSLSILI